MAKAVGNNIAYLGVGTGAALGEWAKSIGVVRNNSVKRSCGYRGCRSPSMAR